MKSLNPLMNEGIIIPYQEKSEHPERRIFPITCKILGTIVEVDEGRIFTGGPENKKTNDVADDLTYKIGRRQTIYVKKKKEELASNGDSVDKSIRRLKGHIKRVK